MRWESKRGEGREGEEPAPKYFGLEPALSIFSINLLKAKRPKASYIAEKYMVCHPHNKHV